MIVTRILTVVLIAISLGMFGYLYTSIDGVIEQRNAISSKEQAVTDRLKLIREAEIVFESVHGRYTANWDSLANFIQNGRVPIVERREEIIQKAYGGEDVKVHIDTLGYITAKEKIFRKNYTLNASDDGTLKEFRVKTGDPVIKNQKAVVILSAGKPLEVPFIENGTIDAMADLKPGDAVKKGQILINYSNYVFDINTDISKIGFKPGTDVKFDIFVGKVDKAGVMVQVIEVKDPMPDNPARKENAEQATRRPLRFGSRLDVSTAGNWE